MTSRSSTLAANILLNLKGDTQKNCSGLQRIAAEIS